MPSSQPPLLRGVDLRKRYGSDQNTVDALRGVGIEFPAHSFTAIMGRSGSGKSTLMQLLAGLDRPTGGWVEIAGVRLDKLSRRELTLHRREHVGFVFQAYNLLPVLNAQDNIRLPLAIAGKAIDRDWLDAVIKAVDLADRRKHRPAELSGGQQQRVAIARALVTKPSIVFADEPTGNLDSHSGREVLELLNRTVHEYGQTVVLVTHDPQAASIADRVVFLRDGQIVSDHAHLSTDEIFEKLKTL